MCGSGVGGLAGFEEREEASCGVVGGAFFGELLAGAHEGGAEAGWLERLEQVVERVDLEGVHGVFVEGGDEDDGRGFFLQLAQDGEAGQLGHLDVDEKDVGEALAQSGEGGAAIRAFANNLNVGLGGEEGADALPGEGLIVDDEGGEFHAGTTVVATGRSVRKGKTISTRTPPSGGEMSVRRARPWWRARRRSVELERPMP